jgi:hypothetical protein
METVVVEIADKASVNRRLGKIPVCEDRENGLLH